MPEYKNQAELNVTTQNHIKTNYSKESDRFGVIYTPQSIVSFMVRSVKEILKAQNRDMEDVKILDPFVGTGNYMIEIMKQLKTPNLDNLEAFEIMPYSFEIAQQNLDDTYFQLTSQKGKFNLILCDTFDQFNSLFSSKVDVVIGNPPYNRDQQNENDNNKNKKHPELDSRILETYAKDSRATNKTACYDTYVKAFRWSCDKINDNGIIAFITNNSFIQAMSLDGMRKHLREEFEALYIIDLGGNIRQGALREGNVFGVKVGICIIFLIKQWHKKGIFYHKTDETWTKEQKFEWLDGLNSFLEV